MTEKRTWYFKSDDPHAMRNAMELCRQAKTRCWLYAVDDRVVWSEDVAARIDLTHLKSPVP